jgi:hypothetical protein
MPCLSHWHRCLIRRPWSLGRWDRAQISPCGIFGRQSGTRRGFSPSSSILSVSITPQRLSILINNLETNTRTISGRSLEAQSHHINMNRNRKKDMLDWLKSVWKYISTFKRQSVIQITVKDKIIPELQFTSEAFPGLFSWTLSLLLILRTILTSIIQFLIGLFHIFLSLTLSELLVAFFRLNASNQMKFLICNKRLFLDIYFSLTSHFQSQFIKREVFLAMEVGG